MAVDALPSARRLSARTFWCGVILITGASGRIARRRAELLGRSGHRLRLMTRSPQRAPKLAEAETVRGDFAEPATLEEAFAGVTTALVVSGSGQPGERARLHSHAFQSAAQARVRTRRASILARCTSMVRRPCKAITSIMSRSRNLVAQVARWRGAAAVILDAILDFCRRNSEMRGLFIGKVVLPAPRSLRLVVRRFADLWTGQA